MDEVYCIIPSNILTAVMQVLMLLKARDISLIKGSIPAKQLAQNPKKIKALNRYESLIRDLLAIGLHLEWLERENFITAMSFRRFHGLLTNYALFWAIAQRFRVTDIVSADGQFKDVKGIIYYSPVDMKS